jgi:hypothetical protein
MNLSWFWGMNFFFTWAGLLIVQIGLLLHVIGCFEVFTQLEVSY